MNISINIKQFKLYLWIGLAFLLVGLLGDLATHPATFPGRALNDLWSVSYVTVLNYFLFEYTLPTLSRKRILTSLLLILVQIYLYSWVAYAWKYIGIQLHIYTAFITVPSLSRAVTNQMGYSVGA